MIVSDPSDEGGNKHHKLGTFMIDNQIYILCVDDTLSIKVYDENGSPVTDDRIVEKVWKLYMSYLF